MLKSLDYGIHGPSLGLLKIGRGGHMQVQCMRVCVYIRIDIHNMGVCFFGASGL